MNPIRNISTLQESIWLTQHIYPQSTLFNVGGYAFIDGALQLPHLIKAINLVLEGADVIERGYAIFNDIPFNENQEFVPCDMDIIDFFHHKQAEAECRRWMEQDMQQPFDVTKNLLKIRFIITGESSCCWYTKVHHVLFDGYAMALFFNKVAELYTSYVKEVDAPALPGYAYADFIADEIEYKSTEQYGADKQWWLQRLDGVATGSAFQSIVHAGGKTSMRSHRVERRISRQLFNAITAFCEHHHLTAFHYFVATLFALHKRYNNADELLLGIPIFNRNKKQFRETLGAFVNVFPFTTPIYSGMTFTALLKQVGGELKDCYRHQRFPLYDLLKARDQPGNIYNVAFSYQRTSYDTSLGNTSVFINYLPAPEQQEDLFFHLLEYTAGADLTFAVDYAAELFPSHVIENLIDHFEHLLQAALDTPLAAIQDLPYLSVEEEVQLLETFNISSPGYPSGETIISQFEARVQATPDSIALVFEDCTLSYAVLNAHANQLAHYLQARYQLAPDDLIGLQLSRSEWLVTGILGILKAGCGYVPIDPNYPEDRIDYIKSDSRCKVVIDAAELAVFLDARLSFAETNPVQQASPGHLAYVIYTSGSTGLPKGVMIEHRQVISFFSNFHNSYLFEPGMVWGSATNYTFDISVLEILGSLTGGIQLVLLSSTDPQGLIQEMRDKQVTILQLTPSRLSQLLESNDSAIAFLGDLKYLLVGGEALGQQHYDRLKELTGTRVLNMYGPTETTIWSSSLELQGSAALTIGKPLLHEATYIMDSHQQLCAIGITGEICIGGAGLARGYLYREELTAEKFIPHPYRAGERLYRTGDLGRWLADGTISFLGRNDDQVKIRGYRIEPGEIERALQTHPGVASAVVLAITSGSGSPEIVAYLLGTEPLQSTELRAHLQKHLPVYMLPEHYVQLDAFPLNASGKVDRKRLPSPQGLGLSAGREYIGPRNGTEAQLVQIWEEVLGRTGISIKDNFFELGGHSLKVTRLESFLYKAFEVKIPLHDLFGVPVLEDQAVLIERSQKISYNGITPVPVQPSYPLSSSQRRLWVLSQFAEGNIAYNMPGAYVFEGDLSLPSLTYAFNELIRRHEILRTVFHEDSNGEVRQFIHHANASGFTIESIDLRNVVNQHARLQQLAERSATKSFDLSRGPLLRAVLFHTDEERWVLAYTMHHIVGDGWSMDVLFRELLHIYNAHTKNTPHALPGLRIQYKDYATWQQSQLTSGTMAVAQVYWLKQFEGELPQLALPLDHPRPVVRTYNGGVVIRQLPVDQVMAMKSLVREQGATLFMGLLGLVNVLLHRYTKQEDIIIGTPIAGRSHVDLIDQIGLYINTLALRTCFSSQDDFLDLLKQIRENTLAAYEHQGYPFDELLEQLQLQRDMSRNALFDVMVILQNNERKYMSGEGSLNNLQISRYENHNREISKLDITFEFEETGQELSLRIQYNTDLFEAASIHRMATHLELLLGAVVRTPQLSINKLPYLSVEEEVQLLETFNVSSPGYPSGETIISQFEARVQAAPDSIALVFEDCTLSYAALNAHANQLAHYLQARYQLAPDDLIGLQLSRSEWLVTGILGILKAGCGYVPIDPNYPEDRIDYIKSDSRCKVVIDAAELAVFLDARLSFAETNPVQQASPGHLAYVIYTSGSTGLPKGVMIEHRQVISFFSNFHNSYLFEPGMVWGSVTNYTFDISVLEILGSLTGGIQLVLLSSTDPQGLIQEMRDKQVTILQLTPSRLSQLLESNDSAIAFLGDLKYLLVGGEALGQQHYDRLKELTGTRVLNMYGPTETTIWSSSLELQGSAALTIGKPLLHEATYIMDSHQQLCAIGITGEICIGGAGLARGYLYREELTAEKFIPHPYRAGERLYRTGDLGRWLADGMISFLGRNDDQVKIRGYRIEPGEIERALQTHPGVASAVVLAITSGNGSPEIVAYLLGTEPLQSTELRAHLQKHLPVYMLPEHYVQLDAFPLNASGKVDRKRLPSPQGLGLSAGREYIGPRNGTEAQLVQIWEEVLGRTGISIKDNFFELGGHSLKVTRLVSRIFKDFGVKLALKELFANAILEEQATLVDHSQKGTYTAIAPLTERPNYVLSSSQRRLWVLSQFEESNTAYNMPGVYVIKGRLQPALLGAAFNAVIVRHEILRTVFNSDEEGEVRQYVQLASEDFKVLFKDVRGQVASLPAIIDNFCNAGFELATGPLMRVGVFEVSDQEWVLAFVMHHIISDGWSLGVLIRELLQVYNQPATAGDLPPLAIQYKDYAVWQQEQLSSGILAQQRAYWLSQLAGELPVLALAGDRPRPAVKTYKGAQVHRQLDADLSLQLALLVQAANSTLFMGITAAVNALLYRYTKQEDIIVGTPVAGREHSDLENQIGFYVNTLTLRTRLSGDNSYRELLDIIRDVTLQAYEHQAYPFDELVDDLQLQRDMSRNPLFDVMVQLQDGELTPKLNNTSINGITIQGYNGKRTTISKFDLSFIFEPTNVGMNMVVDYCTDIFNAATIERLASHFVQLLAAMLESPTMPVKKINYLTKQEEQVLLRQFNDTRVDYPADKTLPALFAEQVIIQPQRIALVFGATAYSYKELDELSNRFANFLQEQHQVQPGDLIGIKQERSEWLIITILGILKAGGAYVPIDPVYPEDRIAFMLSDTNCRVMITADELTQFQATIGCYSTFSPVCMQTPDSLAYIMYTSGSTGTPKGVMVSHRNIVRLVRSCGYVALTGQEALLSTGAVSFDATTFEYWGMLLNGGKLVLCSQDSLLDEQLMTQVIAGNKVDIMWFTAGWLHQLIDKDINIFAGLKTIIAGGDKLSALHINRLRRHYPGMQVINGYGPTENTTFSLTYNIQSSMSDIPLGYPINNSTVYIMDELLQLCPVGVTGEIIVGGDGLALGYLNRTELTAEKFIDHPYVSGERVYRTGDLGRWLPDGSIAFIGRRDDQVKIRGYRIEPGEIEHVLQAYPGISSALLVVFSTASGEKELAAYFTGEPGLDAIEIRAYLGKHLPAYMLPDYYVQLDSFPLTPNGKVDKKKLPSPQSGGRASDREYVAPRNATEEQLLVIWKEILGRSDISVKDNFFEMGGHSLRATRLASQLYKVFEVKIPLKELFGAPVLEDQAVLITSARKTTYSSILPAILQSSYPLSSSQRRLWLLSQLENGNVAYNIPGVYVFIGELHLASLNFAFNELIQRHEILRTVFRENEKGELRQYIVPAAQQLFSIQYTDLRTAKDQDQRVEALVKAGATQPFNLAEGPLLRAGLYQVGDSRWVFAYTVHHIISDGWSMEILIRELLLIYNHHVQGIPHSLLPLAIQYKDYACWQQAQLEDGILAADQVYWLLQLEGELPVLELPTDHVRSAVRTYKSGVVTHQFPEHAVEQLRTLCQQQGATMFMGLQGLVNVLLHRYTQQEDIITGTPVAGRGHADLLDQIGFYVNTLALRIRFSGGDSYTTLLDHVREVTLAAFEHQAYPFDELVDQLDLQRDVSRNVLFDVMVMLQHDQSSLRHIPSMHGLDIQGYESNSLEVSKFDITFAFIESGASLTVNIKYNTDLFDPSTIERMATHLEQLLHTVTSRPDSPINMLPYLTEAEEDRLLNTFSSSHVSFDRRATVVSMFEAQIRKMPDQIALVHEGQTLTYAALNKRANQLAHYLQEHHQAGAGMLTGILADRSIDMMVAILGILKAGSAYVPIDPEFPEARIQYLLQDSGVQVIVTQSRYRTMVDTFNVAAVYLDDSAAVMEMPDEDPVMAAMPADLAYVIYTSGSTGQPKGVMITHGALADYAYGILARTNIAECRTFGLVSTIAADLGNTVIYTSLLIGGTLYIYSTQTLMSGEELFATPVDCIKIVPSHWKALQPAGGPLFAPQKCLVFGGEQLTGDVLTLLYNNHAGCQVYNHYGPSETTIGKLINRVSLTENDGVIPLGTPFCNSFFCIIDPQFQLTGIGITGEICIGGDGLSPGYLHREALTAERFVANPFCPGERMYRTGDLGRWLPDGNIVFMGRSDDQVKIRGYRIELGEIASVMQSHEDIDAAVVIARSNAVGEKELVSYFTGNSAVSKTSLRTFLAQRLPSYSLPAHYVQLESLPLTANGKIDRRQLPVPEGLGLTGTTQYITAGTPTEKLLTSIWEELLHRTSIGIDDNFFEMGGHSLMAVKLVNRINRELSASIKVADVFHHTSIRELAQLIDSCPQQADESVIPVAPLAAGYVLSTNQRRLWLTCQQADNTVAYNIPGALLLEGPLNTALLKDAYLLLTARHESLRTVLVNDEVLPEQKILPAGYPDFEIQEVAYMPAREEIDQLVRIESSIPFPMDDQLLVRVKILVFPDNRYLLMVVMHHIISDGWSMEIFIKEWIALYAGLQQGKLPALPPMVIQYKDYAVWQQHYISSPAFQKEISYWQQRLAGELPVLNLPFAQARSAAMGIDGDVFSFMVDDSLYTGLQQLALNRQCTLYSLMFTAFNVLLYHISHQQEVILGTSVAGRRHESLESIIGFFVNTLAIKTSINTGETFVQLLQRTSTQLLRDFEHQDMPFEELVTHLDYERIPGVNPVFQARFVLNSERENDLAGLEELNIKASPIGIREVNAKFDLSLIIRPGRNLSGMIEYRSQLFRKEIITLIAEGYLQLLAAVIADPEVAVAQLDTFNSGYKHYLSTSKKAVKDNLLKKLQSLQKK